MRIVSVLGVCRPRRGKAQNYTFYRCFDISVLEEAGAECKVREFCECFGWFPKKHFLRLFRMYEICKCFGGFSSEAWKDLKLHVSSVF
jgi:hypothetical protein